MAHDSYDSIALSLAESIGRISAVLEMSSATDAEKVASIRKILDERRG